MAIYKIVDGAQLDNDLKSVADSIRAKTGATETMLFPDGFKEKIDEITTASGKPFIDTSKIANFSNFFNNGSRLELLELIDTCNGTNFADMFSGCETLKKIPFFDFSKGTNFSQIFYGCYELEQLPPLDFSKGTNFAYAFSWCAALTEIPLVDISRATNLNFTFEGCLLLTTLSLTTAKTDFHTASFRDCPELANLTIGENWKTSIYLNYSEKLTVESLHGMIENLADLTGKTSKKFQIGATNLAKIDEAHIQMLNDKNWNYS